MTITNRLVALSLLLLGTTFVSGFLLPNSRKIRARRTFLGPMKPITEINSPQELADFLNQDDRICVVKFYATFCKSCKKMGFKFQAFANKYKHQDMLRFGAIQYDTNGKFCSALQVHRLPFVHLYADGEQLAGFPCPPSKFFRLKESVGYHVQQRSPSTSFDLTFPFAAIPTPTPVTPELINELIVLDANGQLSSKPMVVQKKSPVGQQQAVARPQEQAQHIPNQQTLQQQQPQPQTFLQQQQIQQQQETIKQDFQPQGIFPEEKKIHHTWAYYITTIIPRH